MPDIAERTKAFFRNPFNTAAITSITSSAGRTTPSVAQAAPARPACVLPTKVAMFTAMGPGVDSQTPINRTSVCSSSQPRERASCRIIGSMA